MPVIEAARKAGLSITTYYGMADGRVFIDPVLHAIGNRHGKSIAQVVLRWLLQQEGLVALSKTVTAARAAENLTIFDFELSNEEMALIHALAKPDGGRLVSPPGLAPEWDAAV